jgi:phosphoribosylanthranilate isomerase
MRTRVKVCGMTRREDIEAAARAGADAIGLVFYPPSPRFLQLAQARQLAASVPPFMCCVALFVNPAAGEVRAVLETVRPTMLQFHGEETPEFCAQFGVAYLKACRVRPGVDLVKYFAPFSGAAGWLLDSHVAEYGGVGASFDWSLVPAESMRDEMRPLVLSGGLTRDNVGEAIRRVRPWAVDVSSGVEVSKGVKDAAKIAAFITEVRNADG